MKVQYIEYKPGTKFAPKNAEISDFHESFSDCGYYLGKELIAIDIDSLPKETIKEMLKFFQIKTQLCWTDRGVHLFFKKPIDMKQAFQNGVCPLGFNIEQKTSTNSPNGITCKREGKKRPVENEGIFEELPYFFRVRFKTEPLLGLQEGDGRNQAIYSWKMKLKNCEGWYDILRFINKYIFAEPLDDKEFEQAAREGATIESDSTPFGVATYIINEFKCINYNDDIWWMKDDVYIKDIEDKMITRLVWNMNIFKKTKDVQEVVKQVRDRSKVIFSDTEFNIRLKNGVWLQDGFFADIDYKDFTPYCIDINYDPNAKPVQIVDEYINQLTSNDADYRRLLIQALGYPLITRKESIRSLAKFFIFRGEGGNGKGTLLQIIQRIYGAGNCSNMDIDELCDPRNNVSMLDKLVNLGDDMKAETIDNKKMKMLKNISTCDTVNTRRLYHEGKSVTFIAKMFFTTNSGVKSYEKGKSYQRRVVWMPMFTEVKKADPKFITKLTTEDALEYWLKLIVEGAIDLLENGWHESKIVEDFNNEYHKSNNIYIEFLEDMDFDHQIKGQKLSDIRSAFDDWKDDEDIKFNSKLFQDTLYQKFHAGFGRKRVANEGNIKIVMLESETSQDIKPKS